MNIFFFCSYRSLRTQPDPSCAVNIAARTAMLCQTTEKERQRGTRRCPAEATYTLIDVYRAVQPPMENVCLVRYNTSAVEMV